MRVQIIHRNRLFRECLQSVLAELLRIEELPAEAADNELRATLARQQPDLVLVDLSLDEAARQVADYARQDKVSCRVILLVSSDAGKSIVEFIEDGVHGCVLEESSLTELRSAIEKVVGGETYCSPQIANSMFEQLARVSRRSQWQERVEEVNLTRRELEILQLIARRFSNKEIARRLSISVYTVKNHVHNMLEKLQVGTRFEAVDRARDHRWLNGTSP